MIGIVRIVQGDLPTEVPNAVVHGAGVVTGALALIPVDR